MGSDEFLGAYAKVLARALRADGIVCAFCRHKLSIALAWCLNPDYTSTLTSPQPARNGYPALKLILDQPRLRRQRLEPYQSIYMLLALTKDGQMHHLVCETPDAFISIPLGDQKMTFRFAFTQDLAEPDAIDIAVRQIVYNMNAHFGNATCR